MQSITRFLSWSRPLFERLRARKKRRRLLKLGNPEERFTHFYSVNRWGNEESRSGPGSTMSYTEHLRKELPRLFANLGVQTILDAPCGDYHWFGQIERHADLNYIGGDIVAPLVRDNQQQFSNENTTFMHLDITADALPVADLWLCRDCLFHLCEADVYRAIQRFLESEIRYLLASTHTQCQHNRDITTGACRLLNLEAPPYNFPAPRLYLDDWVDGFPVRYLGLWERTTLSASLAVNGWLDRTTARPS